MRFASRLLVTSWICLLLCVAVLHAGVYGRSGSLGYGRRRGPIARVAVQPARWSRGPGPTFVARPSGWSGRPSPRFVARPSRWNGNGNGNGNGWNGNGNGWGGSGGSRITIGFRKMGGGYGGGGSSGGYSNGD